MTRRFLVILLILLHPLLFSCAKEPPQPLRVGTHVWPGFEPLYLARELGYYADTSIRLIQYPSPTELRRALQSGLIEVATLTVDEALVLKDRGYDPQILAVADFSNGADVILGQRGMKTLHDLKGKRVGVESTAFGAFVLTRALEKEGISLKEVKLVYLEMSEHEEAFRSGKVDGLVTFVPVSTSLISHGAVRLFNSSMIPGEIVDVLVVRRKDMQQHLSSLESLVNGWFRAVDYLKRRPAEASAIIAPREKVTPDQFIESLEGIHIPDREEYAAIAAGRSSNLRESMVSLNKVMATKGLVRHVQEPVPLINIDEMKKAR